MRKLWLAMAVIASTAVFGTASASASISLLDLVKQNSAANSCTNLGGTPDLLWPGVDCEYVANLNIPRQILAGALCGALGWQFAVLGTIPHEGEYICAKYLKV
jgi:hypothetical protein